MKSTFFNFKRSEKEQFENIPTIVFSSADDACNPVANEIATLIKDRQKKGAHVVLGLATGSTPVRLYRQLIRMHKEEGLSFKNVFTFNLDEYYGLDCKHPESYWRFMQDQLFAHIDISNENINVPDGTVARDKVFEYCQSYEDKIKKLGGIDIQILGIGRTGHIGFNEPGSTADSRTRLVTLDALTRRDAARDFLGESKVPRHAITMGVGTILDAKQVFLLAWGQSKAEVIAKAIEGEKIESLPASFLQLHQNCTFLIDNSASLGLTRFQYPWRVGQVQWSDSLIRKAVIWLCNRTKKTVLKLRESDYAEHGLSDLVTYHGSAYELNIRIFNEVQHTITGWPGGKPNADDTYRPERALPASKRSLVFSPEPSTAERSMGATLSRLVRQKHDVMLAYMTSGNLAVSDLDAINSAEFVSAVSACSMGTPIIAINTLKELKCKNAFEQDSPVIRSFKGLIRRNEARSSTQVLGLSKEKIHFLDLPFYENGRYRRFTWKNDDVKIIENILKEHKPHQIFATGYDADPSGIASQCFQILIQALNSFRDEKWFKDCRIWLYPDEDNVHQLHEINMTVPISPDELQEKLQSIYRHNSQRNQTPGNGNSEAWHVAEELNRTLASNVNAFGLAEYEAMESFKKYEII